MEAKPTTRRFEWKRFNNIVKKIHVKACNFLCSSLINTIIVVKIPSQTVHFGFFLTFKLFWQQKAQLPSTNTSQCKIRILAPPFHHFVPLQVVKYCFEEISFSPKFQRKQIKLEGVCSLFNWAFKMLLIKILLFHLLWRFDLQRQFISFFWRDLSRPSEARGNPLKLMFKSFFLYTNGSRPFAMIKIICFGKWKNVLN